MLTKSLANYDVFPKVVPAGQVSRIAISPLGSHAAFKQAEFTVEFLPKMSNREPNFDYDHQNFMVDADGILRISYLFPTEQEYYLRLYHIGNKADPANAVITFRIYALEEDLYQRTPYKGDFHSHSYYSDGSEEPAIVAANYRKAGFDFLAITDHHQYKPSQIVKEDYLDIPMDLILLSGEEIHPIGNHIHMLSIGGQFSVNQLFDVDLAAYRNQVQTLIDTLDIPADVDAFTYASCIWTFRKVKEAGGISVFCHPHWLADTFHVPDSMSRALFASKEFDAFELLGGHEVYSNNIQLAFYAEERAKGNTCPVVGVSDAHSTVESQWFNWTYSLVFAQGPTESQIIHAVKDSYSVAVEHYPGEEYRVHGPYRIVLYARFLMDCYFPVHNELCFEEGRLMKEAYLGQEKACKLLGELKGRCQGLTNRWWGR